MLLWMHKRGHYRLKGIDPHWINNIAMLPDYPKAKKELFLCVMRHFNNVVRPYRMGVPIEPVMEGDTCSYTRHDGSHDTVQFKRFETLFEVEDAELASLTWRDVLNKVGEAAAKLGNDMFLSMLSKIEEITQQTGKRVDMGGNATPKKFIEMVRDTMILNFDKNGNPILPTLVGGNYAADVIKNIFEEIQRSPELQKKYKEAIAVQKELWRDRESYRKLVD